MIERRLERVAVIAADHKVFWHRMEEIAYALPRDVFVKFERQFSRATIGGTEYDFIYEPRRLRGKTFDRVMVLWLGYRRREELDEMEAILRTRGLSMYDRALP